MPRLLRQIGIDPKWGNKMKLKILIFSLLFLYSAVSSSTTKLELIPGKWKASIGYALKHYSYWQSNHFGPNKVDAFVPNQISFNSEYISNGWDTWIDLEAYKVSSRINHTDKSIQLTTLEGGISYHHYILYFSRRENPLFEREGSEQVTKYNLYWIGLGYKREWKLSETPSLYFSTRLGLLAPLFHTSSNDELSLQDTSGYYLKGSWSLQRLISKSEGYEVYIDGGINLSFQGLRQKVEWESVETRINNEILDASVILGFQVRL